MSTPHIIRLRGPWQPAPSAEEDGPIASLLRNFHRPTNLAVGDRVELVFQGVRIAAAVRLNDRHLGDLTPSELVLRELVQGELIPGNAVLDDAVPEEPAPCDTQRRWEITPWLEPRNTLRLEFPAPPPHAPARPLPRPSRRPLPAEWIEEVRLEIFDSESALGR